MMDSAGVAIPRSRKTSETWGTRPVTIIVSHSSAENAEEWATLHFFGIQSCAWAWVPILPGLDYRLPIFRRERGRMGRPSFLWDSELRLAWVPILPGLDYRPPIFRRERGRMGHPSFICD